MNFNPKTGFSEQDYQLLKSAVAGVGGGAKPYEFLEQIPITASTPEWTKTLAAPLNDLIILIYLPPTSSQLILRLRGTTSTLTKYVALATDANTGTSHCVSFKNTEGIYEMSYNHPCTGEVGVAAQIGWAAKTPNSGLENSYQPFLQLPVSQLHIEGSDDIPAGTVVVILKR